MSKVLISAFIVLAIAFLGITLLKNSPKASRQHSEPTAEQEADKTKVVDFWDAYNKATNLRTSGKYGEAATYYEAALRINPSHNNALYHLGNMRLTLHKYRQAEDVWQKLVHVNAHSARGFSQLGLLYSCKEPGNPLYNLEKAANRFKRASQLNLEETGPLLQLAKVRLAQYRAKEAARLLGDVISSNFKSAEAFFLKGYLAWKEGRSSEAGNLLEQSVTIVNGTAGKENIGEGDTETGTSPMFDESIQCELYSEQYQQVVVKTIQNSLPPREAYSLFDSAIQ